MPLNDRRPPRANRTLVNLGTIRKGTTNEKGIPKDEEFFVLNEKDAPALRKVYGSKATELKVFVPFPEAARNFDAYYELWKGSVCACRGDGVTITSALDPQKNLNYVVMDGYANASYNEENTQLYTIGAQVPCSGHKQDLYPRCKECGPVGILLVMVRDPQRPQYLVNDENGYYILRTGSLRDIETLSAQLAKIEADMRALGAPNGLQGVQLVLRRIPENMTYPDEKSGKRKSAERSFLHIMVDPQWMAALIAAQQRAARQVLDAGTPFELPDRVEEGQIIDPATGDLTLPVEEPPTETGDDPPRPWTVEQCRRYVRAIVQSCKPETHDQLIPAQQREQLRHLLMGVVANDDERHALQFSLLNVESLSQMTYAEGKALFAWAQNQEMAAREASDLLAALEVEG